jgi:DNA repair protein RecO (recombination protein O)
VASLYRERGVVLRTHRLGEADRIVVLLTAGRGKVRAVAKGVRKTRSRFGGRLEPASHLALQLYEGRELDTITQAESLDAFRRLREDLSRLTAALGMLEAVDQVAGERHADPPLYAMLVGALRALAAPGTPPELVVSAFYWKLLAHDGATPILDVCASCGRDGGSDLVAFDLLEGGALCRSCRRGSPVSAEALALVRQILGGQLAAALRHPPGPAVDEVVQLATTAMETHLERRLRAVRMGH